MATAVAGRRLGSQFTRLVATLRPASVNCESAWHARRDYSVSSSAASTLGCACIALFSGSITKIGVLYASGMEFEGCDVSDALYWSNQLEYAPLLVTIS